MGVNCEADAAAVEKLKEGGEIKFRLELDGADVMEDVGAASVWETRVICGCVESSHADFLDRAERVERVLEDLGLCLFNFTIIS